MSKKGEENARVHAICELVYRSFLFFCSIRIAFPGRQHLPFPLAESMGDSPRRSQLTDAGSRIFSPSELI